MSKKNSGGLFGALTMKQTDGLAVRLANGALRLAEEAGDYDASQEVYGVAHDLHESWTARADQGERPETSKRVHRK